MWESTYSFEMKSKWYSVGLDWFFIEMESEYGTVILGDFDVLSRCSFSKDDVVVHDAGHRKLRAKLSLDFSILDRVKPDFCSSLVIKVRPSLQFRKHVYHRACFRDQKLKLFLLSLSATMFTNIPVRLFPPSLGLH